MELLLSRFTKYDEQNSAIAFVKKNNVNFSILITHSLFESLQITLGSKNCIRNVC